METRKKDWQVRRSPVDQLRASNDILRPQEAKNWAETKNTANFAPSFMIKLTFDFLDGKPFGEVKKPDELIISTHRGGGLIKTWSQAS